MNVRNSTCIKIIDRLFNRKLTVKRRAFLWRIIVKLWPCMHIRRNNKSPPTNKLSMLYRISSTEQVQHTLPICRSSVNKSEVPKAIELVDFRSCAKREQYAFSMAWTCFVYNNNFVSTHTLKGRYIWNIFLNIFVKHTIYYIWDTRQFLLFFLSINGRVFKCNQTAFYKFT